MRRYPRQADPLRLVAATMQFEPAEAAALIARLGREAGKPWRQEHRLAAAAALTVLAAQRRR